MKKGKNWVVLLGLSITTLVFCLASVFMPWWNIATTREQAILKGKSITAEYSLLQRVDTFKTEAGNETHIATSLNDMPAGEAEKTSLGSLLNTNLILTLSASTFVTLTLGLIFASSLRKPLYKYAGYTSMIAAILLLIASVYFAGEFSSIITKFQSVTPSSMYTLPGNTISGLWGQTGASALPDAWKWGPAFGWFLAFTAFQLNLVTFILIRIFRGDDVAS